MFKTRISTQHLVEIDRWYYDFDQGHSHMGKSSTFLIFPQITIIFFLIFPQTCLILALGGQLANREGPSYHASGFDMIHTL